MADRLFAVVGIERVCNRKLAGGGVEMVMEGLLLGWVGLGYLLHLPSHFVK
jgi:hypothetical protein